MSQVGGMTFEGLPVSAAWQHLHVRTGFEVAHFRVVDGSVTADGCTTASEDGRHWVVGYRIALDAGGRTRRAHVTGRSGPLERSTVLDQDAAGRWEVDGRPVPALDGCLDVDLESSAFTNALPVARLRLAVGETAQAPAAYVRAADLGVERLEQVYVRLPDEHGLVRFDYRAPAFDVRCTIAYDGTGLVADYPGLARRVA